MAAARENALGFCRCPLCANKRAALRLSAKQLPYIVCPNCQMQLFTRGEVSDRLARDLKVADEPEPAPAPPAPAPVHQPAPAPTEKRTSWGFIR